MGKHIHHIPDLVFSSGRGRDLCLDLLIPEPIESPPLAVVLHGGGWRVGSRKDTGLEWLAEEGYAVAKIEYRYSSEACFPAQIEDCRSALDWLQERAGELGYSTEPTFALGTSAGGTLALLLGSEARVAAVVAYCAPCDLILRGLAQPHLTESPGGLVHALLGGPVSARQALAAQASPARQVGPATVPTLLFQGTEDRQVLNDQALAYATAALQYGRDVRLVSVPGGGHCGEIYHTPERRALVRAFLAEHCGAACRLGVGVR